MKATRRKFIATTSTVAGASIFGRTANEAPLEAGTARVEITPPAGQPMGGFLNRLKVKGGAYEDIHDPLFARVLLLQSGKITLGIITVDLLFFSSRRLIEEAKKKWSIDHVILSSTHTHAGPIPKTGGMVEWSNLNVNPQETLDFEAFSKDPWYAKTEDDIIGAIGEAMQNRFPARIGAGSVEFDSVYMPHNRRHVAPDGKVTMQWDNPKRLPSSPVDKTLRVLRVDDESGKPRAMLTHFACHPVTLGSRNRSISADFPGAAVTHLENELGDDCMGMFLQGASGDIDPYEMGLQEKYGHEIVHNAGVSLATKALEVADKIKTSSSEVQVKESMLSFRQRHKEDRLDVSISTIMIGQDISLTSIPGEPFVTHQINLAKAAPSKHTFLLGLSYNGSGIPFTIYLPTIQATKQGGYGATSGTFLEVGAGERMIKETLTTIQQLKA